MIWFTSDTHFGHANIIKMCDRPFAHQGEMDRALVDNWNSLVAPDDTVYHLGDFCWYNQPRRARDTFNRLNGRKHLIVGNHDHKLTRRLSWESVQDELAVELNDGIVVHLCHYPPKNSWFDGRLYLHGHIHTRKSKAMQSFPVIDVGVDAMKMMPVGQTWVEAKARDYLRQGSLLAGLQNVGGSAGRRLQQASDEAYEREVAEAEAECRRYDELGGPF